MENHKLKQQGDYAFTTILLVTQHGKSVAIAPPFWDRLQATVMEYVVNTDRLGTFSGEIERQGSALECARRKCELAFAVSDQVKFALASEGSFGPHPSMPFMPCDHEILYFIDKQNDFHLPLSLLSTKTNYRTQVIHSLEELQIFAESVQFPSHALILRPAEIQDNFPLFKGIDSAADLEAAFKECQPYASQTGIWLETDMRAQYNPTRMGVIGELAATLAKRLATSCPRCRTPGFGTIEAVTGLPCRECRLETLLVQAEIQGCVKCDYTEHEPSQSGMRYAEPRYCPDCNP